MTIYENGEIIDPTNDKRLKGSSHLWMKGISAWSSQTFSRSEVFQLISDLKNIAT